MERATWTNERLHDLAEGMRSGFNRVDQDIRDLRVEMRTGCTEVRGEIESLRRVMLGLGGGTIVTLFGVIAAVLARGV